MSDNNSTEDPDKEIESNLNKDDRINTITIQDEMHSSYLDYAMSVIVSRALPDIRDGLKPVHRRILYAMYESNYNWNRPYRKSARVVGDVMGKYHPHGDSAIYDAMVRMAQPFSMRLKLIDGQGNFGSMDGDPPAAMRYTEVRMAQASSEFIEDLDKDTVDFNENYDGSSKEPAVLPSKIPNLLVNGAGGIAVGMATNIPPHNLAEVIDASLALLEDPTITIESLMETLKGPDFPTGATILGRNGIYSAYTNGKGSITIRGKSKIEENRKGRESIIVSEIPYQVNKSRMIEQIADAVRNKKIDGISDLRDESDRDGVRVVIELKKDANPDVVLNQLYKFSSLQVSFGINLLALNEGKPEQLNIKKTLQVFLNFREELITRRTKFLLENARKRSHVLIGLVIAVYNIDEIIKLVRAAKDTETARENLLKKEWPSEEVIPYLSLIGEENLKSGSKKHKLSVAQAKAILDLRLQRLTGLERDKLNTELQDIAKDIELYLEILRNRDKLLNLISEELIEIKNKYAENRKTEIIDSEYEQDIEDLIQREDMVVTVTKAGYIKRVPVVTYRAQKRGGKGRSGMSTRDEDFLTHLLVLNTHHPVLFFTSIGLVYLLKVYKLPSGTPQAKGRPIVNLLPINPSEMITTMMPLPEQDMGQTLMFVTKKGNVRRNLLSDFTNIKSNGKIAMKLKEKDSLIDVLTCSKDDDVLISTSRGKCIRFNVNSIRIFSGRTSAGIRGIKLSTNDEVISASVLKGVQATVDERDNYLKYASCMRKGEPIDILLEKSRIEELEKSEEFLLTVTENGFGKRTSTYEYRAANRGGLGIKNIEMSKRNGSVVESFPIKETDDVMLVTNKGRLIRSPVNGIRIAGRNTQGVTIFRIETDEKVVSVTKLSSEGQEDK